MSPVTTQPAPPTIDTTVPKSPVWIEGDRRESSRSVGRLYAKLTPMGSSSPISGQAENIGEGGCFVLVADDGALCVGQRCEVDLIEEDGETRLASLPSDCFATVVRTELISSSEGRCLGAGLRFDQPLFI